MESSDIKLSDWTRILQGDVPAAFYLEATFRVVIVYLLLITSMRLLGKRMSSQLSRTDLTAMVVLAAAIGVPILAPDRGIIPAFIIALVVILVQRGLSTMAAKSQKFENISQGGLSTLVKDSVMKPETMKSVRISRERLLAQLRSKGYKHMGRVKRVYLEASGAFIIVEAHDPKPGLSVIPGWDEAFTNELPRDNDTIICKNCGAPWPDKGDNCENCFFDEWTVAVSDAERK